MINIKQNLIINGRVISAVNKLTNEITLANITAINAALYIVNSVFFLFFIA